MGSLAKSFVRGEADRRDAGGCAAEDAAYHRFYPYHAELCALSELRKKPGFGVPVRSGIGGHCLLYLNGVQRDWTTEHPTLKLCPPDAAPARHGVGISVNSHYKNANWIAAEGQDFLWRGALEPGERLTREAYERTQRHARAIGTLDGVAFHDHLFRDKPAGMSVADYMYEISVATDYAARFGRDVYRARIPLDHMRMAAVVAFLNGLNAPYRDGARTFRWRLFNDNCVHLVHNALAAAGVWAPWPTGQFFATAAFDFPVPKNAFVDVMQRGNDFPIQDADAVYRDKFARRNLDEGGVLPAAPGYLAIRSPALGDNDVYDTDRLRLIFYDNPFWGPYRFRFRRIFNEPRYSSLRANLLNFARIYEQASASTTKRSSPEPGRFQQRYERYIAREAAKLRGQLAALDHADAPLPEAVS